MHSHLLPGIDDGSPDTETSVLLKKGLEDLGYSQFITTPHIMWDMYKNTREIIINKLDEVSAKPIKQRVGGYVKYLWNSMFIPVPLKNTIDNANA